MLVVNAQEFWPDWHEPEFEPQMPYAGPTPSGTMYHQ
jgi:hypothetical protein